MTATNSNSVTVQLLSNPPVEIEYDGTTTIAELKARVGEARHIPAQQMALLFRSQYVRDSRTLVECGFGAGDTVQGVLKLAGAVPIEVRVVPGNQVLTARAVPYEPVSSILTQFELRPGLWTVSSRATGEVLDKDEFCGHVRDLLRGGVTISPVAIPIPH
jgi:hypothetical protein